MVKQTVCPNCGGSLRAESHGWICNKCKGFISLRDGKFYEYVEKPFMPPMTNADRIRAMTDEELAHELALIASWDREQYKKAKSIGIEKVMMDWLQQPCKGE